MLNSIVLGAAMLFGGLSMPINQSTVEPQVVMAPVSLQEMMSDETERILIEERAAPYWHLSVSTAWDYYNLGLIEIEEIEVDRVYKLHYDGGILEVVLEGF